jgi:hypothetical protein
MQDCHVATCGFDGQVSSSSLDLEFRYLSAAKGCILFKYVVIFEEERMSCRVAGSGFLVAS